jgi:hypothetical protein
LLPIVKGYNNTSKQVPRNIEDSAHMCVIDEGNKNLMANQKEALKWHFKLGHMGLDWVQWLGREGFLPKSIANVEKPLCASCKIGVGQRQSKGKAKHTQLPKSKGGS